MIQSNTCDTSFSGLKTAVRLMADDLRPLSTQHIADLCAGFQAAVSEAVADRLTRAMARFRAEHPDVAVPALVVSGGVAANRSRAELSARPSPSPANLASSASVPSPCAARRSDRSSSSCSRCWKYRWLNTPVSASVTDRSRRFRRSSTWTN